MSEKSEALRLAECLDEPLYATHKQMTEAAAELRRLSAVEAQRDALLEALHHTAAIVHNGGLQGMNDWQALVAVRKLTLPYFVRSGSIAETHDRVRAAIKKAEDGK